MVFVVNVEKSLNTVGGFPQSSAVHNFALTWEWEKRAGIRNAYLFENVWGFLRGARNVQSGRRAC